MTFENSNQQDQIIEDDHMPEVTNDFHSSEDDDDVENVENDEEIGVSNLEKSISTSPSNDNDEEEDNINSPPKKKKRFSRVRTKIDNYVLTDEQSRGIECINAAEEHERHAAEQVREARKKLEEAEQNQIDAAIASKKVAEEWSDILVSEPCFWNMKYKELKAFHKEYRHCSPQVGFYSKGYADNDYMRKLGHWVTVQRRLARQEPREIRADRYILLDRMGFDWDPIETNWRKRMKEYKELMAEYGHIENFPTDYNDELRQWIRHLRFSYRRKEKLTKEPAHKLIKSSGPTLTPKRLEELKAWNFTWDPYVKEFEDFFELLVAYKKVHGNCHIPEDFTDNPTFELGKYVKNLRKSFVKFSAGNEVRNILNKERVERLHDIGFYFDRTDVTFQKRYDELRLYFFKYGSVGGMAVNNPMLRKWLYQQRAHYTQYKLGKGPMSEERAKALQELGAIKIEPKSSTDCPNSETHKTQPRAYNRGDTPVSRLAVVKSKEKPGDASTTKDLARSNLSSGIDHVLELDKRLSRWLTPQKDSNLNGERSQKKSSLNEGTPQNAHVLRSVGKKTVLTMTL